MKKIGIVTLFGYNNYGNRLQMFAVQRVFKQKGYDSEIIKYYKKKHKEPPLIRLKIFIRYMLYLKSSLLKSYLKNYRIYRFKKHAKTHYNESTSIVDPLKVEPKFHKKYSFLSVGSDQVWGWFNHDIADFIYLQFAPAEKRLTFSPSFGSASIDENYRKKFTKGLQGFKKISVRETSGAQIIKELTDKEATVLCDPTMCLSQHDWLAFASPHKKKPKEKYILTYFLGTTSPKVIKLLSKLSENYTIVELNKKESWAYYTINPSEWIDYIHSASLFLTDSFHGVVFSLIMQTPFVVYKRIGGESMQTRITNILEMFNLEERFEMKVEDSSLLEINFKNTKEIIEIEKNKAFAFLKEQIENL